MAPSNASATTAAVDRDEHMDALRAVFAGVGPDALIALGEGVDRRDYADGAQIYAAGQYEAGEALLVLAGAVRVTRIDATSGAMTVERRHVGETFGLAYAVSGACPHADSLSINAEGDACVLALDGEALVRCARAHSSLCAFLMETFAAEIAAAPLAGAPAGASPAQRVYAELLSYIEPCADRPGAGVIAKLPKHRQLAERTGTEEIDVAKAVADLIREGVAKRRYPGLSVDDVSLLERLAS